MKTNRKDNFKVILSLVLPYVIIFIGILLASFLVFNTVKDNSVYFKLAVGLPTASSDLSDFESTQIITNDDNTSEPDTEIPSVDNYIHEDFPKIKYETQWATLNVDTWAAKNIPVFFGSSAKVLKYAAGHHSGSRFCGQSGRVVICAHVTGLFSELEDTAVGTTVTMDTIYGKYVYKIREFTIFEQSDLSILIPDTKGEDTLVLYTCYPRFNNYKRRVMRIAAICELVSGKEYAAYVPEQQS